VPSLSPLTLWVRIPIRRGILDTTLCDKACQWIAAGPWFSPGTPVSSTNKTARHDITEILLKVAWNTINQPIYWMVSSYFLYAAESIFYDLYMEQYTSSGTKQDALNNNKKEHFKSDLINNWESINICQVCVCCFHLYICVCTVNLLILLSCLYRHRILLEHCLDHVVVLEDISIQRNVLMNYIN